MLTHVRGARQCCVRRCECLPVLSFFLWVRVWLCLWSSLRVRDCVRLSACVSACLCRGTLAGFELCREIQVAKAASGVLSAFNHSNSHCSSWLGRSYPCVGVDFKGARMGKGSTRWHMRPGLNVLGKMRVTGSRSQSVAICSASITPCPRTRPNCFSPTKGRIQENAPNAFPQVTAGIHNGV